MANCAIGRGRLTSHWCHSVSGVYYNEIDEFCASWLRELMKAKQIPDGEVDTRSITDVQPDDVRGFHQCHFFAGIGGWAYALRLAGWPDEREVWTGSCPCQPFSAAGRRDGGADSRHLWPSWFRLVRERRPDCLFGEQVESAIGHGWIDVVFDDLEREDYAVATVGLPAAGVGSFHLRQRLWFVADAGSERRQQDTRCAPCDEGKDGRQSHGDYISTSNGEIGDLGHATNIGRTWGRQHHRGEKTCDRAASAFGSTRRQQATERRAPSAFWRSVEWIRCLDGRTRPIEPGTWPLAYGVSNRVVKLRGYGNAIVPQVAQVFIEAYLDCCGAL